VAVEMPPLRGRDASATATSVSGRREVRRMGGMLVPSGDQRVRLPDNT